MDISMEAESDCEKSIMGRMVDLENVGCSNADEVQSKA
jgi:hypothetical protein